MAERAAHFSYTTQFKPSIFDIVAQNSLNVTLQPAFQKISEFLAECNPKYFRWLVDYQDESFLTFNSLLQYYYLKNYDASFSEYFYGVCRVSIKDIPLLKRQRYLSLLFLVILPYIKRKLDKKLDTYKIENAEGILKSQGKKFLLYSQSTLEVTWNLWLVMNYIRYMADAMDSQNPILWLLKLKLIYAEELEDLSFWSALFMRRLSVREFIGGIFQNSLRTSLEIGAFFVQFIQTWYKENPNYNITALPTAPPPQPDPNAESYKRKCPICLQQWKIPTVLPVSGYVFCFSCIVKHLREEQRCPVTSYPARPMDIIRLYDS